MPNSTWIGSINIKDWIDTLYDTEVKQLQAISDKQMQVYSNTGKGLNVQVSTYGQLQSLMSTFKQSIANVKTAFDSISYKIDSSDTTVATATITNNNVLPGMHAISITSLAAAEKEQSKVFSSKTDELKISTTLDIQVGATIVHVPVASDDSLEDVRDNIKTATANLGVGATILATNDGGGR